MAKVWEDVKKYTEEEHLIDLLAHHYQLTINSVEPMGGILKMNADTGTFVLKRIKDNEISLWKWISELKEYIAKNETNNIHIPTPLMTVSNRLSFAGYQHSYVVLPWIEGERIRLKSLQEWEETTRMIARFHQSTAGFRPSNGKIRNANQWKKWKEIYQQLEVFHLAAKLTSIPSEVDQIWLQTAVYTTTVIENLLDYYKKINGDQICDQVSSLSSICHGSLHPRNILVDDKRKMALIDWNRAMVEIRTMDIVQWLFYAYVRTGSKEVTATILKSYHEVSPISENEHALIYAFMLFPEKISRIIWSFYYDQSIQEKEAISVVRKQSHIERKKLHMLQDYIEVLEQDFQMFIPKIDWIHRQH